MSTKIQIKPYITGDFYKHLAYRESGNRPSVVNQFGYLGLFQMGEEALEDSGYYLKSENEKEHLQKWDGVWLGKNGIFCKEDFLNNKYIQNIAIREYHSLVWQKYLKDYHHFVGKEILGIKLTKVGILSGAHLVGPNRIIQFLESDGKVFPSDSNGATCFSYIEKFAQCDANI